MAEIKPIRAWRYNESLEQKIDELTSPLFDVVSDRQRNALYQNPYNSIHLSVPQGSDAANKAGQLLENWKNEGIIVQDKLPAIYVYYQYFKLAGRTKEFCRKGFICHIRAYDWNERVILRHENTIPKSVNDRIELLEKTELNVSPTHGLYTDSEHELERFMDEAITVAIYEGEDYQGVRDVLAVIQDANIIQKFIDVIKDKSIILADGHHRYEGSMLYKQKQKALNPNNTGNEGYNFHLMYLTNTEADDLRILPTHRLLHGFKDFNENEIIEKLRDDFEIKEIEDADTLNEIIIGKKWAFGILFKDRTLKIRLKPESFIRLLHGFKNFNENEIIEKLRDDFEIKEIEDADTLNEIIVGKKWAFGILFKDRTLKIRLKPESFLKMKWNFPEEVKALDLTILHYFIIEKILEIPGKDQRKSENISFDRSFSDCLTKVIRSEAQMAIITQEISIEEVKKVCASGYTLPQKSTYFYPKVICGFLFSSIKEDEFQSPTYSIY